MFKQFDYKILVGILFIGLLFVAGSYFYSQRSYERFASDIGASPDFTTSSKVVPEKDTTKSAEKSKATQLPIRFNERIKVESKPVAVSESTNTTEDKEVTAEKTETSEMDASSLMSAFGIPEEVTSLFDEDVDEADLEKAKTHLTEKYGQTPEVEAIIDKLKQMSGGPVALDDLTALFEAWIQVLPEDQQKTRRQLMNALTQLNSVKSLGGSEVPAIIEIEVTDIETLDD